MHTNAERVKKVTQMNKTKAAKRDLFKTKLYSVVILLLAIMVALLGILQKVSDAGHLIDRHNISHNRYWLHTDYYDKETTIAKANKAKRLGRTHCRQDKFVTSGVI